MALMQFDEVAGQGSFQAIGEGRGLRVGRHAHTTVCQSELSP